VEVPFDKYIVYAALTPLTSLSRALRAPGALKGALK